MFAQICCEATYQGFQAHKRRLKKLLGIPWRPFCLFLACRSGGWEPTRLNPGLRIRCDGQCCLKRVYSCLSNSCRTQIPRVFFVLLQGAMAKAEVHVAAGLGASREKCAERKGRGTLQSRMLAHVVIYGKRSSSRSRHALLESKAA